MIRNRIVIGITDKVVSEKLQMITDLTLTKAVEVTRQCEMVKQQMVHEPLKKSVDFVRHKTQSTKEKIDPPAYKQTKKKKPSTANAHQCRHCGKGTHT